MNLIYFYVYSGNPFSGVNKKIFSQASSLDRIVTKFKLLLIEDSIEQRIIKKNSIYGLLFLDSTIYVS